MGQATHGEGYPVGALDAGGEDGYVGRDGQPVGDGPRHGPPGAAAS